MTDLDKLDRLAEAQAYARALQMMFASDLLCRDACTPLSQVCSQLEDAIQDVKGAIAAEQVQHAA